MARVTTLGASLVAVLGGLILALGCLDRGVAKDAGDAAAAPPETTPTTRSWTVPAPAVHAHSGFLYGRVTVDGGRTYEGRLRWGGDQEAFWSDYFDGAKDRNPWAAYSPLERSAQGQGGIEIFGFELGGPDRSNLDRLFLARFGDIARVEAHFATVHVTLKSGTVITLDRFSAGDIDDGVRIWDPRHGTMDIDARRIRVIEFLPTPPLVDGPLRLHGVVRASGKEFTGFIQWNQHDGVSTDTLDGRADGEDVSLPYASIRSITRRSRDSVAVTLLDGRTIELSGRREVGRNNRGIYVDDPRYGRVLVSWQSFERVDFHPDGTGPGYADFVSGRRLTGIVATRDGRRLSGRLVYDLDESETTETLEVSSENLDYGIPFDLIAAIVTAPRGAEASAPVRIVLCGGDELAVERAGDVGERNAGVLIFAAGEKDPRHVAWSDVERIEFDCLSEHRK
jgi:hypothetical protein